MTVQKRRGNYKSKILELAGGDAIQYWGGGGLLAHVRGRDS